MNMKRTIHYIGILGLLFIFNGCANDDDGSTTTGNTDEYFNYTIDGVERIFDFEVEGHLETQTTTSIDIFEINASGQQPSGEFRRIAVAFSFVNTGAFLPSTTYNWGLASENTPTERFYFSESTPSNLFILSGDFNTHPIVATITSTIPNTVGDYLEFTFSGTFQDDNNIMRMISGECRVQRDADQDF